MKIKNLVFEGGGVKGIAYVGAIDILNTEGILKGVTGVGGTSAGAITACLLSLQLSTEEMSNIMWGLDFRSLMDDSFGMVRDVHRLVNNYGWFKGDYFHKWLEEICYRKTGEVSVTFEEIVKIKGVDLRLVGANLSTGQSEVFSPRTTPEMSISLAARISMSIPLFFQAVIYEDCLYVDGGLYRNYPIRIFDDIYEQEETLGFRVDSPEQIKEFGRVGEPAAKEIVSFDQYLKVLAGALLSVQEDRHLHSGDWDRTVYINTGDIGAVDFDLSEDQKKFLFERGQVGTSTYLETSGRVEAKLRFEEERGELY